MSAPRMMPSVWRKVISPAETKPMSISVVAAEDWMIAVTAAPEATAIGRWRAMPVSSERRRPPAARYHQHVLAVRVQGADVIHGGAYARADGVERLAAGGRAVVRREQPRPIGIALAAAHLVHGAAFPLPQRQLAQLVEGDERKAGAGQRHFRRLARAAERAHVRRGHAIAAQRAPQGRGLRAPALRERDVRPALEAALRVPHRLAVARQQEPHRAAFAAASRAARSRASVSSRPSSPSTSNRGGDAVRPVTASRVSCARSTSFSPIASASSRYSASSDAGVNGSTAASRSISAPSRSTPAGVKSLLADLASYSAGRSK